MTEKELIDYTNQVAKDLKGLYEKLINEATSWQWYSREYFSPEPFEAEKQGREKARLLKKEPKEKLGKAICGENRQGQVTIQIECENFGRDKVFIYLPDDSIFEIAFAKDFTVYYSKIYVLANGLVSKYYQKHFSGNKQFEQEVYKYNTNDKLITSELFWTDSFYRTDYYYRYFYNDIDALIEIRADINRDHNGKKSKAKDALIYKKKKDKNSLQHQT
jgi:hypothetical protein